MSTQDAPTLAAALRQFAAEECPGEPLYQAISRHAASDPDLLALLALAPPEQRRPVLLLAALHERVLAGAGGALAAYYASVGGCRAPDAELPAALAELLHREAEALRHSLRQRATQTNEVGRCAVLWPALSALAEATGAQRLALLDFGCGAGLNLGVPAYHYRYRAATREFSLGAPSDGARAEVTTDWQGEPPPKTAWRLAARAGLDPAPIDLADPDQLRWLYACLWPADRARAERLRRATVQALAARWPVQRAADCIAAIEPWLDTLPPGLQPLLFNSWVLTYLPAEERVRLNATIDRLTRSHGLAWLSAEMPALSARDRPAPPFEASPELGSATLWTLRWRAGPAIAERALAWSHPHGRWLRWL